MDLHFGNRTTTSYVFGSSTPRQFSHLESMKPEDRVYDSKPKRWVSTRSRTTPAMTTMSSSTKETPQDSNYIMTRSTYIARKKSGDDDGREEIGSRPDVIQGRSTEQTSVGIKNSIHRGDSEQKKPSENADKQKKVRDQKAFHEQKEHLATENRSNENAGRVHKQVKEGNEVSDSKVERSADGLQPQDSATVVEEGHVRRETPENPVGQVVDRASVSEKFTDSSGMFEQCDNEDESRIECLKSQDGAQDNEGRRKEDKDQNSDMSLREDNKNSTSDDGKHIETKKTMPKAVESGPYTRQWGEQSKI
ncbi:hypothetical protein AB6A40_007676 [Gnathostoma spinigerum]|uniref:Uncharacterized protein n=1 Tax=Gnathostoma spinigerum TaxID=75299 RepID=A0ABD6EP49_9BILA